jgi:4-hydroxy-tetrahydrodipicolinate reductase
MTIKVGVIGAAGRMGSETCRAVEADAGFELVARLGRGDSLDQLVDAAASVAVEFSTPDSVKANTLGCVERELPVVVGATGMREDDLAEIERAAVKHGVGVFVAPNFAVGAVLMMRFAVQAAPFFDVAEVIEMHDAKKKDAPSGTALRTAALLNEARKSPWQELPRGTESVPGSRGGDVDGVRVHSVRSPGAVAHQEVILGAPGQTLSISHDSVDRSSFMPGVLLAINRVRSIDGLVVGLEHLLEL